MKFKRTLILAAVLGSLLLLDCYYYSNWWFSRKNPSASPPAPKLSAQQSQIQIDDLKLHGTALPACPLLFPLLDSKGQITPLGSYLSYFGMKQAAYLPQAILSLPDLDQVFGGFDLFGAESSVDTFYKDQLPYQFQTQDFAEGTWKKTYQGWKIHLRFWGTKPEKIYNQSFAKGALHNAPGWIAACLQDYIGFKPSADQASLLAQPVFNDDADLLRAANLETLFNHGGARLIPHWQDILAKNPDQSEVLRRWMEILDSRENRFHPELMEALLKKQPTCGLASQSLAAEYLKAGRFSDALPLFFSLLKNDDNNNALYAGTLDCLENLGDWEDAVQLNRNWTQKYPQNPEGWMALGLTLVKDTDYFLKKEASVTDSAAPVTTVSPDITEAFAAAQKASQLSPGDVRVWTLLMATGYNARQSQTLLDSYLQKAILLDPADDTPFEAHLTNLETQGMVDVQDAWNFARQNAAQHPFLFYNLASFELSSTSPAQTLDNLKKFKETAALEQAYRDDLKRDPGNLDLWREYLKWTDLAATTPKALAFAQTLVAGHLELKTLPPTLVLLSWEAASANQNPQAGKPKAVSQIAEADQALLVQDGGNWRVWNEYAKLCVENHLDAEAKKAMDAIGDNCDTSVWPQQDFDKARVALGLDPIPPQPGTPPQSASPGMSEPSAVSTSATEVIPPAPSPTKAVEVPAVSVKTKIEPPEASPEPALAPSPIPTAVVETTPLETPAVSPAKPTPAMTLVPMASTTGTIAPVAVLKIQTPITTADLARIRIPSPQPTINPVVSPGPSLTPATPAATP
jgi:tetratricopeptide (TPR) repeat protein